MTEFEEVYRRYFRDVYRYCLALCRDEQMAEEGGYLYHVSLETDGMVLPDGQTDPTWIYEAVTLTTGGTTVDDDSWDEETIARKNAFVETYRTEIVNIITAAEREWPFLAEGVS